MKCCGGSSTVECFLPKEEVEGSIPFHRSLDFVFNLKNWNYKISVRQNEYFDCVDVNHESNTNEGGQISHPDFVGIRVSCLISEANKFVAKDIVLREIRV
jgi:hypothetical protein